MPTMLLSQAETALQTADKVAGLPAAAILALACGGLIWFVLQLREELRKEREANDKLQDDRLKDLKETMGLLGGGHKEAA